MTICSVQRHVDASGNCTCSDNDLPLPCPALMLTYLLYGTTHNMQTPCAYCVVSNAHKQVQTMPGSAQSRVLKLMHPTVPDAGHAICNDGSWLYPHASPLTRHGHARSNASHAQHARHVPRRPHGIPGNAHGPGALRLHGPRAGGHPHADGFPYHVWCLPAASGDAVCNACYEP